jgi:hypothetical protein
VATENIITASAIVAVILFMVSKEELQEIVLIYEKKYGVKPSEKVAETIALNLSQLYKVVYGAPGTNNK